MQIKKLAEEMDFEVLLGIVDCLWVIGVLISAIKRLLENKTGILN